FPTHSTFLGRRGIWLEALFVRPEGRGAGVGTALLHHLFELAGDGRVEWAVLDWNEPSDRLLSRSEERRVGKECRARGGSDQAEDGIRDYKVTGVQTCALPIFPDPFDVPRAARYLAGSPLRPPGRTGRRCRHGAAPPSLRTRRRRPRRMGGAGLERTVGSPST